MDWTWLNLKNKEEICQTCGQLCCPILGTTERVCAVCVCLCGDTDRIVALQGHPTIVNNMGHPVVTTRGAWFVTPAQLHLGLSFLAFEDKETSLVADWEDMFQKGKVAVLV